MSGKLYIDLSHHSIDDLMRRIIELEPMVTNGNKRIKKREWDEMLDKNPELEEDKVVADGTTGGGIRHSAIHSLKNGILYEIEYYEERLKSVQNSDFKRKTNLDRDGLRQLIRKADKFLFALYTWKPELDVTEIMTGQEASKISKESEIIGDEEVAVVEEAGDTASLDEELKKSKTLVWYLYFLHFVEDGRGRKKPKIARTNLFVYPDGSVKLKNLKKDSNSRNYEGNWEQLDGCKVYSFNLCQPSEKVKERHLHFKVKFPNGRKRILFGSYTTYDTDDVYSGSLLFERIDEKSVLNGDIKPPLAISYDENPKEFKEFNKYVIEYLSLARDNHLFTDGPLGNFKELKRWMETENPFSLSERRFFDYPIPRLFIACPQTSLRADDDEHEKFVNKLASDLKTQFKDVLEITIKQKKDENGEMSSRENLKYLQRTKYFILILNDVDKATFSMVQLGWAMAHCKNILVFYKPETVSSRFIDTKRLGFSKHPYNDTNDGYNEVLKIILDFIDTNP